MPTVSRIVSALCSIVARPSSSKISKGVSVRVMNGTFSATSCRRAARRASRPPPRRPRACVVSSMAGILRSRGVVHVSVVQGYKYGPMVGDPDDHRPDSSWVVVFDPPQEDGRYVRDITCLRERMAPGDAIPLHTHEIDEVVMVDGGHGLYRLDGEEIPIDPGGVAFIPAGTPHGLRNDGDGE